jgi:peptidoglycan/LPS O-acetylase OafA/YrhL
LHVDPAAGLPAMSETGTLSAGPAGSAVGEPGLKVNRLGHIDAMRGVAAMAVVLQHSLELVGLDSPVFNLGRFGVVLFFFLSGFVIPFSFSGDQPVRRFLITRFFRLYPAYWAPLAAALLVTDFPPWVAAVNLTMIQNGLGVPNVVQAYWSLFYELFFYLICVVLWLRGRPMLWTGVLALFFLSQFWSQFAVVGFMLTGTLVRYFLMEKNREAAPWAVAAVVGTVAVAFSKFLGSDDFLFGYATGELAALTCFLLVILAKPRSILCEWFGKISYSIYLLHGVVLLAMPLIWAPAYVALVCGISIALAAMNYRWVEEPSIRIGKQMAKRSARRALQAA